MGGTDTADAVHDLPLDLIFIVKPCVRCLPLQSSVAVPVEPGSMLWVISTRLPARKTCAAAGVDALPSSLPTV
jgi:hypothetical protein